MDAIKHLVTGGMSIASIQLLDQIPTDPASIPEIIKLVVQVAVGLATLWHMFKKKKDNVTPE